MQGTTQRILVIHDVKEYSIAGEFEALNDVQVYAKKTEHSIYSYPIDNTNYSFSGGKIVFNQNYDLNQYNAIKLYEGREYSTQERSFNTMSDITPGNLEESFSKLFDNLSTLEKEVFRNVLRIDGDVESDPLLIPLPEEETFLFFKDGKWTTKELKYLDNEVQNAIQEIADSGSSEVGKVVSEGGTQVARVTEEGNKQDARLTNRTTSVVGSVTTEGNTQVARLDSKTSQSINEVSIEGSTQKANVVKEGDSQVLRVVAVNNTIIETGNTQVARVDSKGDTQVARVGTEGDAQFNRIKDKGEAIDQTAANVQAANEAVEENVKNIDATVLEINVAAENSVTVANDLLRYLGSDKNFFSGSLNAQTERSLKIIGDYTMEAIKLIQRRMDKLEGMK